MEVRRLFGEEESLVFESIAGLHKEVISEGFLSTLGDSFLVTLYKTLASSSVAFILVAEDGKEVVGFIAGSLATGKVYKDFMRRAGLKSLFVMLPKLLSPARVKRILETLLYPKKQRDSELPDPEILNFCVKGDRQGAGVGGMLFRALCEEMKSRQVEKIRIVTGGNQVSAQAFYEAKGAVLAKEIEVHSGDKSLVYLYDIV